MYLAFFILAALDLLDALDAACSPEERQDYIDWIYICQHPDGGFKMWRGTDFDDLANEENARWDPANMAATYFALCALLTLGDDLKRVKRKETLRWLRKMQRSDGSFGETLVEGQIEGANDPRWSHCASGARYILRGSREGTVQIDGEDVEDIDIDALVSSIIRAEVRLSIFSYPSISADVSQSYDGGIADLPFHEPHAGYTFCSLGALQFVNRLKIEPTASTSRQTAPTNPQDVVRWLVHRQTDLLDPNAGLDAEFQGPSATKLTPEELERLSSAQTDPTSLPISLNADCASMNGRTNKAADTCYAWWSCASLHILGRGTLYDWTAVRKYLLSKTQHPFLGGFGKFPGDLPDLYHSYLGLAALSLTGSDEVKEVDPGMCASAEAKARLKDIWRDWCIKE
jgi:geranylgeranyl transferase type-1 subunit beta